MPIYEYQCRSCGHRLEAIQAVADEPLTFCPECQQAELKRLVSAVAFQLKGTGWYETDFKNKGRGTTNQEGSADGAAKESESTASAASASGNKDDSAGSSAANSAAKESASQPGSAKKGDGAGSKAASSSG